MTRSIDCVTVGLRLHTETMMRAIGGFFFISIWAMGGVLC